MCENQEKLNISFFFEENENENENWEINIYDILLKIENVELYDGDAFSQFIQYKENYTVKELLLICEYYGFSKELKNNKMNKDNIVKFLINFELNANNNDIVFKRKNMWFYMNELKNDKFMKRYVIW